MNRTVREWIKKGEADYRSAERELQVKEGANYDLVCFLSQQCAEKLMKALLISKSVLPPKTHDLRTLDRLITEAIKGWSVDEDELVFLSGAAVDFRYPGETADYETAAEAIGICGKLRSKLLELLAD